MKLISSNIKLSKALFVAMLVFVSIISLYKFHILYADILTIVFIAKTFILFIFLFLIILYINKISVAELCKLTTIFTNATLFSFLLIFINYLFPQLFTISQQFYINILSAIFIFLLLYTDRLLNNSLPKQNATISTPRKKALYVYASLFVIIIIGATLRAWNLDYIQGADNFNILSARSLHENGSFVYPRNKHLTYVISFFFDILGTHFWVARIPTITLSIISIPAMYLLGSIINKKVGLLSALLLAISPMEIEGASFVREYSELFLYSTLATFFLLHTYKQYSKNKIASDILFKKYIYTIIAIVLIVFTYSFVFNSDTLKSLLSIVAFITVYLVYFFVKNEHSHHLKRVTIYLSILVILFVSFIFIPVTIFTKYLTYNQYWLQVFFDPQVQVPMQWFSFSGVTSFFIFTIFISSIFLKNNILLKVFYWVFFSILLLFVFKYDATTHYLHARYLKYLMPIYIVIMSTSLLHLYHTLIKKSNNFFIKGFLIILACTILFPLSNIIHASKHDLSMFNSRPSKRQASTTANRNDFMKVINTLQFYNISNKDAILIQGESPFYITWFLNYPITRYYTTKSGYRYDVGDKVFVSSHFLDELPMAIQRYPEGYMLWHSSKYPPKDFIYKTSTKFTYLTSVVGYKLYKWSPLNSL